MRRVVLNGETVEFEGDAPGTCREACELVQGFLAGQGLAVDSVQVDGAAVTLEDAANLESYFVLEIASITPLEQLLQMCGTWKSGIEEQLAEMNSLGSFVLRNAWEKSQAAVVALLEKMRPLIEGIGVLQNFGSESGAAWAEQVTAAFEGGLAGIDGVADAVESGDCVWLSDAVALGLSEGWSSVGACLQDVVVPALEEQIK